MPWVCHGILFIFHGHLTIHLQPEKRFRRNVGRMTISQKKTIFGRKKKPSRSPVRFPTDLFWQDSGGLKPFAPDFSCQFLSEIFIYLISTKWKVSHGHEKSLPTAQGRGGFFQGCSSSKRSFWGSKWVHITNEKGVYNYLLHNGLWHQSSVTFLLTCDLLPCSGRS